jgi:adenosylmethionine-8-amino-7-oxononanoate aminotransferase
MTSPRLHAAPLEDRTGGSLGAADHDSLWHPYTRQRTWSEETPLIVERAEGTTLYDAEGNAYIDGVASLWCNVHGHRHPRIDAAVRAQLERVAHSTLFGLSHRPAIELAERLVAIAPPGLTRVFYSESGSAAVETALKLAFQWWARQGEPRRTRFVFLEEDYHGDTIGSASLGGIDSFRALSGPLLFDALRATPGNAGEMEALLDAHGEEVVAVIVEPLVQGAAGIRVQPEGYLRRVRDLCDAHGVLLICDEVATGFGRTGRMFACEHEDVTPDLLCVAKGLTGGYLPLSATLATERIYDGFLDSGGGPGAEAGSFAHGHTYSGNPLACAAGVATLELFETERTLERLAPKIELLAALLAEWVTPLEEVAEVRQLGFMVGIELDGATPLGQKGHAVTLAARRRGAILRPLDDVVVLMPPLSITEAELRRLVAIAAEAIVEAAADTAAGSPLRRIDREQL